MQHWKKNAAIFLTSQTISMFGSDIVYWAIYWYITGVTGGSGIWATLFIIAGFVPTLFLTPFAGVWADRYNKKYLINISDGFIAGVTLVMALLFMLVFKEHYWLLLVALALRTIASSVQMPAVSAMLPDIIDREHLTRVNGIYGTLQAIIKIAGPATAGALLTIPYVTVEMMFFVDIVTALVAILILAFFLKIPKHVKEAQIQRHANSKGYFEEIKSGFAYVKRTRFLKHFFIYFPIVCIMAAPVAFLTAAQATRNFGLNENSWELSAIQVCFCIGMIIGGLSISAWGGFKNRVHTVVLAGLLIGVMSLLLGVPFFTKNNIYYYLIPIVFAGSALPLFNTPANVILQERVDPAYLGRMFSIMTIMSSSMMPMGMLLFGPLADLFPIEWLMIASGIIILCITFIISRDKPVLEAGTRKLNEELETAYK
ncbi:MAG: MFS transporter [Oscillospiraceae bacterium]|jgi:DHA3 family macrolide efflux protein-like MFS transporter|nr:MFS transporter [Oscillospiraceae bacterium]